MREISYMAPKKIAKTQKLSHFLDIRWRWSVFHRFELICAWDNPLFGEAEAKVRDFFASKHALLKVNFNVVRDQAL